MRRAFTLIEILVVLALAAIMAGIVTVSMVGSLRTARAEDVAGRIANYDRVTREYARKFGRQSGLVFDLGRGTVARVAADDDADLRDKGGGVLHLPAGFRFNRVMTPSQSAGGGQMTVAISRDGQSPSYALGLTDVSKKEHWIMTAGLTGQTVKLHDEQEAADIFRALSGAPPTPGDDAH